MDKIKLVSQAVLYVLALALTPSCSGSSSALFNEKGKSASKGSGSYSFEYGGKTYKTVEIGEQVWMVENLDYNVEGSKCYGEGGNVLAEGDNDSLVTLTGEEIQANCDKYGRLYSWATAMGFSEKCNNISSKDDADCAISTPHQSICPDGWHIPSNAELDKLFHYADGTSEANSPYSSPIAGKYLKAKIGWNNDGNGDDTHGFSALPGGVGRSENIFRNIGYDGYWWSAAESGEHRNEAYSRSMYNDTYYAYWGYSNKASLYSVRCVKD